MIEVCPFDPRTLAGTPMGMLHCPNCGCMVVAGITHTLHDWGCAYGYGGILDLKREADIEEYLRASGSKLRTLFDSGWGEHEFRSDWSGVDP